MGEHGLVGRGAVAGEREQQGGLEPAAMLIAALEIDVGLPWVVAGGVLENLALHQHRARGGAGIDPDIERVGGFLDGRGTGPVVGPDLRPEFFSRIS